LTLPVTFINAMNVKASDDTLFVEMWDEGARYVATQPGFIATSLHKSQSTAAKFQYHRGLGKPSALRRSHVDRMVEGLSRAVRFRWRGTSLRCNSDDLRHPV
jgi:hypothetical protein